MSNLKKNIEIEILRGLSIALVFLFHFQLALFSRGYLGVDVFFVISGYLMAAIYGDMKTLPQVWDFFERRFNRLLPAYFVVLLLSLLYAAFVVLPHEQGEVDKHAIWSAVYMPNVGFFMDNAYFNKRQFKPFLNFWSLGVELQFYLVLPVITYLFLRSRALLAALLVGSLAAYFIVNSISPKLSFFMMPLRIWEFLIGFMVAKAHIKNPQDQPSFGLSALVLLLASILLFSSTERFLGLVELGVALLTSAVIYFKLPTSFLNSRISHFLQWLGKYSYSIYLLHFPVIVFFSYQPFGGIKNTPDSLLDCLVVVAITLAGSAALYHTIENRFRKKTAFKRPFLMYLVASVLIVAVSSGLKKLNLSFFTEYQQTVAYAWEDRDVYRCGKLSRITDPFVDSCLLTSNPNPKGKRFLLVGDSRADALKRPLADVLDSLGHSLRLMKQNSALGKKYSPQDIANEVRLHQIDTVILHSTARHVLPKSIKGLVTLAEKNHFKVSFIYPTPYHTFSIPGVLFFKEGQSASQLPDRMTKKSYEIDIAELNVELAQITSPNFFRYPVVDYFCHPVCELADEKNRPFYFDRHHLTLTGAWRLKNLFESLTVN
jgi:peptidoglycan/LPS O-acetylase OafA/YrhL